MPIRAPDRAWPGGLEQAAVRDRVSLLRRSRHAVDAVTVRARRAGSADRAALRDDSRRAGDRRPGRHDPRLRPRRAEREWFPFRPVRPVAVLRRCGQGGRDVPASDSLAVADPARHAGGRVVVALRLQVRAALPGRDRRPPRAAWGRGFYGSRFGSFTHPSRIAVRRAGPRIVRTVRGLLRTSARLVRTIRNWAPTG